MLSYKYGQSYLYNGNHICMERLTPTTPWLMLCIYSGLTWCVSQHGPYRFGWAVCWHPAHGWGEAGIAGSHRHSEVTTETARPSRWPLSWTDAAGAGAENTHGTSFNSSWPSDAIWCHRTWSTWVQVMACCLTAPSHYLNQCWLINGVMWHSPKTNFAARSAQDINS